MATARPMRQSSSGSTWLRPASCHHRSSSSAHPLRVLGRPGRGPRRSRRRGRNSAQWSAAKSWLPGTCSRSTRELVADVVGRRLPPVVVDRARADDLEVLRRPRARRRRTVGRERGQQAGARRAAAGATPSTVAGGSSPAASSTVGSRSTAWQNCVAHLPRARRRCRAGQCTISGVRTPPSQA